MFSNDQSFPLIVDVVFLVLPLHVCAPAGHSIVVFPSAKIHQKEPSSEKMTKNAQNG